MDTKLLEEINEKVNIVDLVSNYVELQKTGKNYKGLCPFHQEKTPSFIVSPEKNIAKCMGCGEGGTPITFYKKIKGISLERAAKELAEKVNIHIDIAVDNDPYSTIYKMMEETNQFFRFQLEHTEQGLKASEYLKQRKMDKGVISHFEIGVSSQNSDTLYQVLRDKGFDVNDMLTYGLVKQKEDNSYYDMFMNRITFPIRNLEGHIVGFSARTLDSNESIKYLNTKETPIFKKSQLLYHAFESQMAIRQHKKVIIHEGFFDVMASYQAGFEYAIATMGTALTKEHVGQIKKLTDYVIIAYDGDKAGFEATNKAIKLLEKEHIKMDVAYFPDGLDPDDIVKTKGIQMYQTILTHELKDVYDYRYVHYKNQTRFDISNDRIKFKDLVLKMIEKSDSSIQSLYRKRLAVDLGMELSDLKITSVQEDLPFKVEEKLTKKEDKYLLAEIGIIIGLIQDKSYVDFVKKQLSHQHFSDQDMAMIRYHLFHYYENYETFDLETFLESLKDHYKKVFEQYILQDIDYKNHIKIDMNTLELNIVKIKESIQKRRLHKLTQDRKNKPENAPIYVNESLKIIKKLNGVKH